MKLFKKKKIVEETVESTGTTSAGWRIWKRRVRYEDGDTDEAMYSTRFDIRKGLQVRGDAPEQD